MEDSSRYYHDEVRIDQFASNYAGGAQFALCDGSVRFIGTSIDRDVYRNLSSRAVGVIIGDS